MSFFKRVSRELGSIHHSRDSRTSLDISLLENIAEGPGGGGDSAVDAGVARTADTVEDAAFDSGPEAKASWKDTTTNAANALMGVGLLSLPFALRMSGWWGVLLFMFCAASTFYTGKTLARCCDSNSTIMTYKDIGTKAFGVWGEIFLGGLFFCELIAVCTMYLIVAGDNMEVFVPQVNRRVWYAIAAAVATPSVFLKDLSLLARLSFVGVLSSLAVCLLLMILATFPHIANTGSYGHPAPTEALAWPNISLAVGLIWVGFTAHPLFPSLYKGMAEPKHYGKSLSLAYAIVVLFYGIVAISGYVLFGTATRQIITLNLGSDDAGKFATALFVMLPFTKYSLAMSPVTATVDGFIEPRVGKDKLAIVKVFARLLQVGVTLGLAVVIPNFATLLGITGSVLSFTVSMTFPAACFIRLCARTASPLEMALNYALLLFGVSWAIIGTYVAVSLTPTQTS